MDKLLEALLRNPIILFVVGAWVVGMISNAAKAKKKAEERRRRKQASEPKADATVLQPLPEQRQAPVAERREAPQQRRRATPPAEPKPAVSTPTPSSGQRPDEIAAEMRRILGLEEDPAPAPAPRRPTPPPIERPPEPVRVSARDQGSVRDQGFEIHVDPHVGERIRDRHMRETKVGKPQAGRGAIGNLGGRVQKRKKSAAVRSRYSLDDLRKAIVINEILSPPVSVRGHDERRPS